MRPSSASFRTRRTHQLFEYGDGSVFRRVETLSSLSCIIALVKAHVRLFNIFRHGSRSFTSFLKLFSRPFAINLSEHILFALPRNIQCTFLGKS